MSHGIYSLVRNTDIKVINNYSCDESCKKKSLKLQDPDLVFGGKERLPWGTEIQADTGKKARHYTGEQNG